MTTKIQNLQNKINDKTLTLEERENYFLDLQILENQENELKKFKWLNKLLENKRFIFKNLNNNEIKFNFEFDYNDTYQERNDLFIFNVFVKYEDKKHKHNRKFLTNVVMIDEYDFVYILTEEEINILKEYQKEKNQKNNNVNDDIENEI